MRASISSSLIAVPSAARKIQPSAPISRRIPAEVSETYRSPAARADSTGSTGAAFFARRALTISRVLALAVPALDDVTPFVVVYALGYAMCASGDEDGSPPPAVRKPVGPARPEPTGGSGASSGRP